MNLDTSHFANAGNLQDGMSNFTGLNPQTLQSAATPVAVPTATNPLTQHTSQYLQGNSLPTAPAHPTQTFHLTSQGAVTSSQAGLSLPSHSQGPTPANTPPTVSNDPKGPSQFPPSSYAMSHLQYRPLGQNLVINSGSNRAYNRAGPMPIPRNAPIVYFPSGSVHNGYSILPLQAGPLSQIGNAGLVTTPSFSVPATASSSEHHQGMYYPMSAGSGTPSQGYNPTNYANRSAWNNAGRTTTQSTVPMQPSLIVPGYSNIATMSTLSQQPPQQPQQQQQQQHLQQLPSGSNKKRPNAIKIINPDTGQVVTPDGEKPESDASTVTQSESKTGLVAEFKDEVQKRAKEPTLSSNFNAPLPPTTYANKEPVSSALNGAMPTTTLIPTTKEWKQISQTTTSNLSTISDTVDTITNSLKNSGISTGMHTTKMDYKKPTREEPNLTANESVANDESKQRERPSIPSWPEQRANHSVTTVPAQPLPPRVTNVSNKKIPKESENEFSCSAHGSSAPITNVPVIPSLTAPYDVVNKVGSVTSNSIGVEDKNEAIQKAATKQGIQSSVVVQNFEDTPPAKTSVVPKPASVASSLTLPQTSHPTAAVPAPAQAPSAAKIEIKPPVIVSQQSTNTSQSNPIISQKTPSSAAQTVTSSTQKSSPTVTPSFPAKPANPATVSCPPVADEKSGKEEKSNPSTKSKNRNKESPNEQNDHHAGSKNKTQSFAKHHGVDNSKQVNSSSAAVPTTKQTNGENQESQLASEGKATKKSKKSKREINKKGSEKEGSDMDMFTNIDKTSRNTEKSLRPDKTAQPETANTNANARKPNSSHKPDNDSKENVNINSEVKEKGNSGQNIPPVSILQVPAGPAINKTELILPSPDKVGRRKYDVEFMKSLRSQPQCNAGVDSLPNIAMLRPPPLGTSRSMSQNGFSAAASSFLPPFMQAMPPRMSMGSNRKSQQGMKRDRPNQIHLSLSLKDEVTLRSAKDAWKPARFNPDIKNLSKEEKKTEELYKNVRGILNKLTPEKFPKLIEKIKSLAIDTAGRLQGVIDLIFDKAIDEPGFCRWYAEMCFVMQSVQVPDEETGQTKSFRTLLINKCQHQFERDKADELDAEKKQAEIASCTDPDKKKELQLLFEETERKIRRKSVGNCRFIGELFKLHMLTAKIMVRCVSKLVSQIDEESLECLCKLLTTIGKDLEEKLEKGALEVFFNKMQDISEKKSYAVSSRIRFMLQDVIDLRKNDWVPRRETENPQTIDQINQELEKKEHDSKLANMVQRKQYDDYNKRDFRKNSRHENKPTDEWQTVSGKNSFTNKPYKFELNKLQSIQAPVTESLGPPSTAFSSWRGGANASKPQDKKPSLPIFTSTMPSMNSRVPLNKLTPSNSSEKPKPYPVHQRDDDASKLTRTGSSQSTSAVSRDNSVQRAGSRNASQTASSPAAPPLLSKDVLERCCHTILEEYDVNKDLQDSVDAFQERFNPKQITDVMAEFLNVIIYDKPKLANSCGTLFAALLQKKVVTLQHIMDVLVTIVEVAEDILIDCPRLWTYLAETLSPLFIEDCLSFSEFETTLVEKLPSQRNGPLLKAVNEVISKNEKSKSTGANAQHRIDKYLSEKLSAEEFDKITKWIDDNVENSRHNPIVVTALTKAVCECCFSDSSVSGGEKEPNDIIKKYFQEKFQKLFKLYIENKEDLELCCLNTILVFCEKKEFPRGFLLEMFMKLYENGLVAFETFYQWKQQHGSHRNSSFGVALLSLRSFYEYLDNQSANST